MRQNYLNFPIPKQTGLPSGSTFLLDAFNQLHAIVWFYCFIIIGLITVLFINIYLQQVKQMDNLLGLIKNQKNSIFLKKHPIIYVNPYITYDNWLIELLILIVPFIIVILICIPSTALSYSTGEVHSASASIKVTGEQWAWYNEVTIPVTKPYGFQKENINNLFLITKLQSKVIANIITPVKIANYNHYSLYVLQRVNLLYGFLTQHLYNPKIQHLIWIDLKYLQTKLPLIERQSNYLPSIDKTPQLHNLQLTNIATPIPAMVWTKLTVDATDVIHSYWLWDYGIKLDCIPGNPLQTYIFPKKFGISIGNCAEYCGNGHLNMPIIIKSYDINEPII